MEETRFYEEKNIITSITVGFSARRRYSEEQTGLLQKDFLKKFTFSLSDDGAFAKVLL